MTSSVSFLNEERTVAEESYLGAAHGWCDSPNPVQLLRALNASEWNWAYVGDEYRAILDKSTGKVLMFVYFDWKTREIRPVRREDLP